MKSDAKVEQMAPSPPLDRESYPGIPSRYDYYLGDSIRMRQLLLEKANKTFVCNPMHVRLDVTLWPGQSLTVVRSSEELEHVLLSGQNQKMEWVFIITQDISWSRLKLTIDMFRMIGAYFTILPSFIEIITSFGAKTWEEDEYYSACYRRFHWKVHDFASAYEICYNVRFVELHGRDKPANPWSFRQYAVYHRYNYQDHTSTWIIIRHRESLKDCLRQPRSYEKDHSPWDPLLQHFLFLKSTSSSWRWYLNFLSATIHKTRLRAACQSNPKRTFGHDRLSFAQCQSLELIQSQMKHAVIVLESTISVAENLKDHLSKVASTVRDLVPQQSRDLEELENEFTQLTRQLRLHKRKAEDLVLESQSISVLTQRVIELRNSSATQASNIEIQKFSASAASESRTMVVLGEASRRDARVMKIVSVIALGYLPVGLVASFFSTDLVQLAFLVTDVQRGLGSFILLGAVLTVGTIATAYIWIRRDKLQTQSAVVQVP